MPADADTRERVTAGVFRFRRTKRLGGLAALAAAGIFDFATGPEPTPILFYAPILLALAFVDTWVICLIYALAAAGIALGVNLIHDPARIVSVRSYAAALADWAIVASIVCIVAFCVQERRRLRETKGALEDATLELQDNRRRLDKALREVMRLRNELVMREYQAQFGDAVFATVHELERPLASIAVYVEEFARLIGRAQEMKNPQLVWDELQPLLEKLGERVQSMDRLLREIRDLRTPGPRT